MRLYPPDRLPTALCAELAKLTEAQVLTLLGEIVEPSFHTPFRTDEEFDEALAPITEAYRGAYNRLSAIATWSDAA